MPVVFSRTVTLDARIIEVIHYILIQNPQLQLVCVRHLMAYQSMVVCSMQELLVDLQFPPEEMPTTKTERP